MTGGCQCGGVRYELAAAPLDVYVCHCTECRAQSASAFGVSVIAPAGSLTLTRGVTKSWSRATASGGRLECHFCPDCGTRLWHASPGGTTVSIKGGSLDQPPDLGVATHIWTASLMPGVVIPEAARRFEGEP